MPRPKTIHEEDFFNLEQKRKYLEFTPDNKLTVTRRLFAASAKEENRLGKDLADFTKWDLLNLYSYMNLTSYNVLQNIHTTAKTYISRFRKEDNKDISVYDVTYYDLRKCCNDYVVQNKIITREKILDIVTSMREDECYNPCDAFALLCLFEGISGNDSNEIRELRIQDFCKNGNEITVNLCSGRTIKVSEELYTLAEEANDQSVYYIIRKNGVVVPNPLDSNEYIFRPIERKVNKGRLTIEREALHKRIKIVLRKYNIGYISMKDLRASGIIHMIQEKAKEYGITDKEFFNNEDLMQEVITQYPYERMRELKTAIRNYRPEWKKER